MSAPRQLDADDLPESAWKPLARPPRYQVQTEPRARPANVKQPLVEERGYRDVRLVDEWVAEMPYRPHACKHTYRLIVLRKNLEVSEPRQQRLFDDYRYSLYLTNDWEHTPAEIVYLANPDVVGTATKKTCSPSSRAASGRCGRRSTTS